MQQQYSNTAILLFSRSASEESLIKDFMPCSNGFAKSRFFSSSLNVVRKELHKTNLPVFWIDENQQIGESFGEKFYNAFADVFSEGFEQVIAVGSDSPELTHQLIKDAVSKLKTTQAVLGPSFDGGDYLMGFSKELFQQLDFQSLQWQTDCLHAEMYAQCISLFTTPVLLKQLLDIDNQEDFLNALAQDILDARFVAFFLSKVNNTFFFFKNHNWISVSCADIKSLRAPPIAA